MMARVGEPRGGTWSSFNSIIIRSSACLSSKVTDPVSGRAVAMSASSGPRIVTEIPDGQPARHLATAARAFCCACGLSVILATKRSHSLRFSLGSGAEVLISATLT